MAKQKNVKQDDLLEMEMSIIDKYKKPFSIACVVLVVLVGCVSLWHYLSNKSNRETLEQMYQAEAYFRAGQYDLALNGSDSLSVKGFVELAEGGSKAANMAKAYAGISYAKQGNWAEAIKYLEDFDVKGDNTISVSALRTLAACYANNGDVDKAVATYKKAAKNADGDSFAPVCLMEAAQLLETQGNKADAKALYESIKADYPQMAQTVEKYLQRVAE
ncbi:MAG: tetratricopeptide repeat protein [Bacteroidaceae bacterium]|nr:tetratricopeptide repeat protein [Bacteroidaceae bacterium]